MDKNELRARFRNEWQKHYDIAALRDAGFTRQSCAKCGGAFWALSELEVCGDPACMGYEFIGNAPSSKKLGYVETWDKIKDYFTSHGHGYVVPYPTVARWRDDLYFTIASINDFQPYVVNGEIEAPHNPLIVPQPCIRFGDIANVGVTGRHYTNFVMVGQHAFNTEKTGMFYWKDEALRHDIEYLKVLGVKPEDLVFKEDVWAGGGNFGPCIEYFSRGLELGNCVFMQYETLRGGAERELSTKVIDMGAGLSRLAWITHGSPTSYEIVFGDVIHKMKKEFGVGVDEELFTGYARLSGGLAIDEIADVSAEKARIARELGVDAHELYHGMERLQALYAAADHTCTVLFTSNDGMLPSNGGGGYNLRLILRRVFGFESRFGFNFDFHNIMEGHARHLKGMFPNLMDGAAGAADIVEEERKKFAATKEKSKGKVVQILRSGAKIGYDELRLLYVSHGVPPEYVAELGAENKVDVHIPEDFYDRARAADEAEEEAQKTDVSQFQKTEPLYYGEEGVFEATVLGIIEGKYLVLDKTAFYPDSGGQASDTGEISGSGVASVRMARAAKVNGVILHEISPAHPFEVGEKVEGLVNLSRRRQISRNHTAAHMLNAAARRVLGRHVWQGGSAKDEARAHMDLTHYRRITNEELAEIERVVNGWIMENLKIEVEVLPRNTAEERYGFSLYQGGAVPGKFLRITKIGDIDAEACGGTHHMNKTTGELGFFKIIKREGVQDGLERVVYSAGTGALAFVQSQEALLREGATALSVTESELPRASARFFAEWKERGKKIEKLSEMLASEEARALVGKSSASGKYAIRVLDADMQFLMAVARIISQSDAGAAALVALDGTIVCAAGKGAKSGADAIIAEMAQKYGGRGGGSKAVASGKIAKTPSAEEQ
jgi:alanyl-tRNA synthetase